MTEDKLDENGLTLKTANDIRDELVNGFKSIYGSDIILDSNTQDGQVIDIYTQMATDIREVIQNYYNSMNPDMCRGQIQDIRYRINNLFRKGGNFTIIPVTLVINKTVSLQGLDSNYNDIDATAYGVTDDSENTYYLIDSETFTAGTYVRNFRADSYGDINPVVGTVTNQQKIVTGVTSVNNASAAITVGEDEETDEEFSTRRQKSVENKSQNSNDALRSQLLDLDGVTNAFVYNHDYENYPDEDDADGIPPHYIWVIVEGGANSDIGNVIYANTSGCGTKGAITVNIPTASNQTFIAHFDRTVGVPLYIKFDLQETVKNTIFDYDAIKETIVENLSYETNEVAETSKITEAIRFSINENSGGGVPVNVEISLDGKNYKDYIPSESKLNKFTVDTTRIEFTEINL